jgi:D-glycero-alpha-D-manno-heptose-7-phosphate kinase
MAPGVTTPGIEALDEAMRATGALGTKICGAGGGGCVLILLPDPKNHPRVGEAIDAALAAGPWEPLPLRLSAVGLVLEQAPEA